MTHKLSKDEASKLAALIGSEKEGFKTGISSTSAYPALHEHVVPKIARGDK